MATRYLTDVLQDHGELEWFIRLLQDRKVRSYLEIGSRWGGSFWRVAKGLPKGSTVVAVDLPPATMTAPSLKACVKELFADGYNAHALFLDSHDLATVKKVMKFAPFDACLIDGDHSLAGVRADWENYNWLCDIVAFHDINWKRAPDWQGQRIEVPEFWAELKDRFKHDQCCLDPKNKNNGIGVVFRC